MREKRVDVLISIVSFLQLLFIGFGGAFVNELIQDQSNSTIIYWSSFFTLVLGIIIAYVYSEVYFMTKSQKP